MNLNNQCVKTVTKAIASGSRFQLMSILPLGRCESDNPLPRCEGKSAIYGGSSYKCADCGTDYATLQEVIDCTHWVNTCLR